MPVSRFTRNIHAKFNFRRFRSFGVTDWQRDRFLDLYISNDVILKDVTIIIPVC